MKKIAGLLLALTAHMVLLAQPQDIKTLQETARGFMGQGDFNNAILVLNKALEQSPSNLELNKDLALAYFQKSDYARAQAVLKPLLERTDADASVFQLAGMLNKTTGDIKECDRIYKKGLKLFPGSGALHSDYGELLWAKQDFSAIKEWEKGIETDPGYTGNYYNAAKYYYLTRDKVWSIIYGELFVAMESYSRRTDEIKDLLLESYKKLFTDADMTKNQDAHNPFATAFITIMGHQASVAANGITPQSLTMIRTRFIIEWFDKEAARFPFRLFDYHRQLLKEGSFDAYNQWLFGSAQNLTAFQNWTTAHNDEYRRFTATQRNRLFKQVPGQYYQTAQGKN
ncbi:MAG TPA: tetratricopeptide repeat protein [Chitinophagaceae bacterium]|nr:tetratricopeptide repeat protein [Chitinophagaceae bacterium]